MANEVKSRKAINKGKLNCLKCDLEVLKFFFVVAPSNQKEQFRKSSDKMSTFSKLVNVLMQLTLLAIAGYIIFRTVKTTGMILYTLHPVLMATGVRKYLNC